MKNAGAERISEKGLKAFQEAVEEYAEALAEASAALARHAKRKTVMEEDIKLALK